MYVYLNTQSLDRESLGITLRNVIPNQYKCMVYIRFYKKKFLYIVIKYLSINIVRYMSSN